MQKLMYKKIVLFVFTMLGANVTIAQTDVDNLISDATWYAGEFIAPATDAVIYQVASAWMFSPKKREKWEFTLGVNNNLFIVPNKNKEMTISNADFSFFQIEGVTSNESVIVPTALGSQSTVYLSGTLDVFGSQETVRTIANGINQETVYYPYLQGAIALPYGFEFLAKYSFKNKLKKGEYHIYGFALQHNISQYFKKLEDNNWSIAALLAYNKEDITVDYIKKSSTISLGIESLNGLIDSYQLQLNIAKSFNKLEITAGTVVNISNIKHKFVGDSSGLNLQDILNERIKVLDKNQTVFFGEIGGRYAISKALYFQTTVSFGSELNTNFGLQYEFNKNKNKVNNTNK